MQPFRNTVTTVHGVPFFACATFTPAPRLVTLPLCVGFLDQKHVQVVLDGIFANLLCDCPGSDQAALTYPELAEVRCFSNLIPHSLASG